jgi:hypothetical protein
LGRLSSSHRFGKRNDSLILSLSDGRVGSYLAIVFEYRRSPLAKLLERDIGTLQFHDVAHRDLRPFVAGIYCHMSYTASSTKLHRHQLPIYRASMPLNTHHLWLPLLPSTNVKYIGKVKKF